MDALVRQFLANGVGTGEVRRLAGGNAFGDRGLDGGGIVAFAAEDRLPAIYQFREYAVAGGLMSYGISLSDGYRWVGESAGRLLGGAKPADLPIVQSIKFEFILNQKTATALGIDVSPLLLARADEVIE